MEVRDEDTYGISDPPADWYSIGYEEGVAGLDSIPPKSYGEESYELYQIGWQDGHGEHEDGLAYS